eukprot:PhM_4_TR18751/c2_g1_i1/m.55608
MPVVWQLRARREAGCKVAAGAEETAMRGTVLYAARGERASTEDDEWIYELEKKKMAGTEPTVVLMKSASRERLMGFLEACLMPYCPSVLHTLLARNKIIKLRIAVHRL